MLSWLGEMVVGYLKGLPHQESHGQYGASAPHVQLHYRYSSQAGMAVSNCRQATSIWARKNGKDKIM